MTVPDWRHIELVVFDVDGTLYHQKALRIRMALELGKHSLTARELRTLRILRAYRQKREELAEAETPAFEEVLQADICMRTGVGKDELASIVEEWIERRPLPYLLRTRRSGIAEVFAALRQSGRKVAVLSDYPTERKLTALGLEADFHLAASDPEVGIMKPNSKGLRLLMERAGCTSAETLMIGDRDERDGEIARREGVAAMILDRTSDGEQLQGSLSNLSRALGL